jgi:hypothetical protein
VKQSGRAAYFITFEPQMQQTRKLGRKNLQHRG